jgi:GDP-4-dehydro-6-deoxy-D-mannose reductase
METKITTQPILVTGGTGFAGRHLLQALIDQGYQNLHTTHFGRSVLPDVCSHPSVQVHKVDLTDAEKVAEAVQAIQPAQVYHLASFAAVGKSFEQAQSLMNNNIMLQLHILNAVKNHASEAKVLTIGSAEEYGRVPTVYQEKKIDEHCPFNPVNPYAVTKVTQDLLAQAFYFSYKLNIVRARPFNHIGEGQSVEFVVPAFASQIVAVERGQQDALLVGNLDSVRDFTDVKDMVKAYIVLMNQGKVGEVYNIGSGQGWKIREVLDMLLSYSTQQITVEVDTTRLRPSDVAYFVADNTKIAQLGWKPELPIEVTLQRILSEWRVKA